MSQARYELIVTYDAPPPPGGNRGPFIDSSYACWYLRSGRVSLNWKGKREEALPGEWVLCDPVLKRSQRFSADARILSVRFQILWEGQEIFRVPGLPCHFQARRAPALLPAAEALVREFGPGGDSGGPRPALSPLAHARLQAAFLNFVAQWHGALEALGLGPSGRAQGDPRLARALEMLAQHEGLGVIPYPGLCEASGLSRAQLDRLFLRHLGMSPRRFAERNCLAAAERLLSEGRLSIKECAASLSFVDSSHFAKWFQRMTGMSPKLYRRGGLRT